MKRLNFSAMNPDVAKAIEQMMAEHRDKFSLQKLNLAELARRTAISHQKLRHCSPPLEQKLSSLPPWL